MAYVYRVEHPEKHTGPYQDNGINFCDKFAHDLCDRHPVMHKHHTPLYQRKDVRYGFVSLEMGKEWFGVFGKKGLRYLKKSGMVIGVYRVKKNDYYSELNQAVFDYDKATRIKELDLKEIF